LRRGGSEVVVIQPDEASEAAFATVGGNVLDPAVRRAAALAGLEQGRSQATGDMVGDF
jgi:NTE family protein